ncbi:TDT family transporter [uncultured Anaerococcus sp.]|uniref:TDT family transporter n=1 Tax=uncultured Anaerococcus sp. TaxID=293428 RepID=UPI00343DF38A
MPTFDMALLLLSGFIKESSEAFGRFVYYFALIIHIILIVYYTYKFIIKDFNLKNVYASIFIVYIGIVAASNASPLWEAQKIGRILVYFSFIAILPLLYVVTKRYRSNLEIPKPFIPLFFIYAAPISLMITGYHTAFEEKTFGLVVFLQILAQVLLILSITKLPKIMESGFIPSYSALTFPSVISAIALNASNMYFKNMGYDYKWLDVIVTIEKYFALIVVIYVLLKFLQFIFIDPFKAEDSQEQKQ